MADPNKTDIEVVNMGARPLAIEVVDLKLLPCSVEVFSLADGLVINQRLAYGAITSQDE